jgi:hypothetical protein
MYGDNDVTGIVHENVEITTEHADWYDPQKFARMEKEAWRGWYKATGREKTIQERGSDDDKKVGGIQQNMRVGAYEVVGSWDGDSDSGNSSWLQLVIGVWGRCRRKRIRRDDG